MSDSRFGTARGVVVSQTSSFADVRVGDRVERCRVRGRLKRGDASSDIVVVGDDVVIRIEPGGESLVSEVEPRRSKLSRRHPAKARIVEDVLAANVDVALVCLARGGPSLRPRVIDRYLALAASGDVAPVIVVTKADLPKSETEEESLELYDRLGVPVVCVSVAEPATVERLEPFLRTGIAALVGPSGVGKSSLANLLAPGFEASVGEVDASSGRGRHTTRLARLVATRFGADLVDTPGIRELSAFDVSKERAASLFPEIARAASGCRFRDCAHEKEPGCAVLEAVHDGGIARTRHESYLAIRRGDVDD